MSKKILAILPISIGGRLTTNSIIDGYRQNNCDVTVYDELFNKNIDEVLKESFNQIVGYDFSPLKIKVDKNTGSRRNATITIKADKYSKQIRLSQGGFSNCSYCYNWQLGYSTGQVWGITGYTYMWNSQIPQYGWVMCPYCKGTGSIAN